MGMSDKIEGYLEVGLNDNGEIVINHPDLKPDENGVGHIVFSPDQARHLARLLNKHAAEAERVRNSTEPPPEPAARTTERSRSDRLSPTPKDQP